MPSRKPVATRLERLRHRVIMTPAPILLAALSALMLIYVVGFGLLYWALDAVASSASDEALAGFWDCVYFSLITATTIGYGDLVPTSTGRALAGLEAFAALGLLTISLGVIIAKILAPANPFAFDDHIVLQVSVNPGARPSPDDQKLLPRFAIRCMNVGPSAVHDVSVYLSYRRELDHRRSTMDFDGYDLPCSTDHTIIWGARTRQHMYGSLAQRLRRADGKEIDADLPRGVRPRDAIRVLVTAFNPVLQQRVVGYKDYQLSDWAVDCGRYARIRSDSGRARWRNWSEYDITPYVKCQQCEYLDDCFFRRRHGVVGTADQLAGSCTRESRSPRGTIVMIHGMWCGPWVWDGYKRYFEDLHYRCLAPPLRYHDVSAKAKAPLGLRGISLRDYTEDLERVIGSLPEPPILMGHSMGGLLAQILASRAPATAVVALTPASPRDVWAIRGSVLKSFRGMVGGTLVGKHIRPSLDVATYAMLEQVPFDERAELHEGLVWESGRAAREIAFWGRASHVDRSALTCPTLLVAGGRDHITPSSVVRAAARKYGRVATYKEFAEHAHWIIGEPGWEDVAQYVARWLDLALRDALEQPKPRQAAL